MESKMEEPKKTESKIDQVLEEFVVAMAIQYLQSTCNGKKFEELEVKDKILEPYYDDKYVKSLIKKR